MKAHDAVQMILAKKKSQAAKQTATAFAPINIALCKYWGKRNTELNLPITSSLSISLHHKGARTTIQHYDGNADNIFLNGAVVASKSGFATRLIKFLDLFRADDKTFFQLDIKSNIPIAAGFASSACGFASVVLALDQLYQWQLSKKELSMLARIGSGSACRSLWHGFVEWHAGNNSDGEDCYSELLPTIWSELRVGLLLLSAERKPLSSRLAMQQTTATSPLYKCWPDKAAADLVLLKQAIAQKDFKLLGETAESNALNMHALMMSAWPPIIYSLPETLASMQMIWELRRENQPIYFTQDAGPNLKLLFLQQQEDLVSEVFPNIEIIEPFAKNYE